MEKIGSLNNFANSLNILVFVHERTEISRSMQNEKTATVNLATEVRSIGGTKNIDDILSSERALLRSELARCSDDVVSNLMKSSLTSAVTDLDNATKSLKTVKNVQEYKIVNENISVQNRDRQGSLPKDAFHRFIDSHKSRLANRIKSAETNFEERLLLSERHKNMDTVKKEYMKLQAIALNIPMKENSKEIER